MELETQAPTEVLSVKVPAKVLRMLDALVARDADIKSTRSLVVRTAIVNHLRAASGMPLPR